MGRRSERLPASVRGSGAVAGGGRLVDGWSRSARCRGSPPFAGDHARAADIPDPYGLMSKADNWRTITLDGTDVRVRTPGSAHLLRAGPRHYGATGLPRARS